MDNCYIVLFITTEDYCKVVNNHLKLFQSLVLLPCINLTSCQLQLFSVAISSSCLISYCLRKALILMFSECALRVHDYNQNDVVLCSRRRYMHSVMVHLHVCVCASGGGVQEEAACSWF